MAPLLVPEAVVFRPRKQDVDQLQQRDFLGKPKVQCPHDECVISNPLSFIFIILNSDVKY